MSRGRAVLGANGVKTPLEPEVSEARQWDVFVAENELGHHEQCSAYGVNREGYGYVCERVVLREGGEIVGGAQVLMRDTPIGRLAQVQRGPLAVDDDAGVLRRVVCELEELMRERRVVSLRVDLFAEQAGAERALAEAGFVASAAWCQKRDSLQVTLDVPGEQLLERMKRKTRYSVRSARRAGVQVRVGGEVDVDAFYWLYQMTANHQGFPVLPLEYFTQLWEVFGAAGRVQHFVAYHEDKAVAAVFNAIVGGGMYYGWGGIDRGEDERKLLANYPLHLAAMNWAYESGCTRYDLSGDTMFKRKFTEQRVKWPLPQRKFYGACRGMRRVLTEMSWSRKPVRQGVSRLARRAGALPKMPY